MFYFKYHTFIHNHKCISLIVISNDLASSFSSTCFVVCHNTVCGGHNDFTELTGWKKVHNPLFDVTNTAIKAWGDNTTLVQTADKVDNDFSTTVIIYEFEVSDVSVLLHGLQKFDDNLGGRTDQNLSLASLFCVVDVLKSIVQYGHTNHGEIIKEVFYVLVFLNCFCWAISFSSVSYTASFHFPTLLRAIGMLQDYNRFDSSCCFFIIHYFILLLLLFFFYYYWLVGRGTKIKYFSNSITRRTKQDYYKNSIKNTHQFPPLFL